MVIPLRPFYRLIPGPEVHFVICHVDYSQKVELICTLSMNEESVFPKSLAKYFKMHSIQLCCYMVLLGSQLDLT